MEKENSSIEVAQERQEYWKNFAADFEGTPLFEGFTKLAEQKLKTWEYLEGMEERRQKRALK
ncbi:MAG: hypothetical protein JKY08_07555 [Flavobacteriaceae bacterium]|nr:hypothetical protein [Flavobacteriaceae bacterium]